MFSLSTYKFSKYPIQLLNSYNACQFSTSTKTKFHHVNSNTNLRQNITKNNFSSTKIKLQYISDLHIDSHDNVPIIEPLSNYLAICGDIAQPNADGYKEFIGEQSKKFEKIFIVPGNHDFDLGPMYKKDKVNKWEPFIKSICNEFNNVYYLNCDTHQLTTDILIMGSILWSKPMPLEGIWKDDDPKVVKYLEHVAEHNRHVDWISNTIDKNKNKKIIVLTHFVPSFKLIEDRYKMKGTYSTSWFATDLEYLIKDPVKAWICGHTHSVISCKVNGVKCAINAYGYGYESGYTHKTDIGKIIEIE